MNSQLMQQPTSFLEPAAQNIRNMTKKAWSFQRGVSLQGNVVFMQQNLLLLWLEFKQIQVRQQKFK